MGGNKSKPIETETKRPARNNPINGLKTGDVVIVGGEAFAGVEKLFCIEFKNGEDVAFHFKIVLLNAEGLYNRVKLNTRIGGKWGAEVQMDNVIFLNHHFLIKITCQEDKLSIDIDGDHFADYKHRVSPDKITSVDLFGDADWNRIELPNQVKLLAQCDDHLEFPTVAEVRMAVQGLRISNVQALRADSSTEEGEELAKLIKEGLEVTKKLLGDEKGVWGMIAKAGGYLQKVSSAGSAAFTIMKFINGIGKDSDMTVIKKALEEICKELKSIDKSIQDGFAKLTEHMEFIEFRRDVQNPVIAMFDLYLRCHTVKGTVPIEDFKAICADRKTSPREILSRMYGFLLTDNNIVDSHLKAKKYAYSVYAGWSDVLFDYAIQLITMNTFYYGMACAEHEAAGNKDILIDKEEEINDLVEQLRRMMERLEQIEAARIKTFHTEGHAKFFLREKFKSIKYNRGSNSERLPGDTLATIAYQMKKAWKGFNGPTDAYFIVVRGNSNAQNSNNRGARWHVTDSTKVTVVDNIGAFGDSKDDICLALIQPVTQEMRENNAKLRKDKKEELKKAIDKIDDHEDMGQERMFGKLKGYVLEVPIKPLLIMFNTDCGKWFSGGVPRLVKIMPINYEMTAEAWSSAGGPLPWKYYYGFCNTGNCHANLAQIVVQ